MVFSHTMVCYYLQIFLLLQKHNRIQVYICTIKVCRTAPLPSKSQCLEFFLQPVHNIYTLHIPYNMIRSLIKYKEIKRNLSNIYLTVSVHQCTHEMFVLMYFTHIHTQKEPKCVPVCISVISESDFYKKFLLNARLCFIQKVVISMQFCSL